MWEGFYSVAFGKKTYHAFHELQRHSDEGMGKIVNIDHIRGKPAPLAGGDARKKLRGFP